MEGQKTGKPPKLVMTGKRNKTPETRDTQIPQAVQTAIQNWPYEQIA